MNIKKEADEKLKLYMLLPQLRFKKHNVVPTRNRFIDNNGNLHEDDLSKPILVIYNEIYTFAVYNFMLNQWHFSEEYSKFLKNSEFVWSEEISFNYNQIIERLK